MNTNKNSYTIIYASVMVVIVAFLLAFVSSALKPRRDQNEALDKKKQILASLHLRDFATNEDVESTYNAVVVADAIVDSVGNIVKEGKNKDQDGFTKASKDISPKQLPVYICQIDSTIKYVVPITGRGLWGGLWGYIAIDDDLQTIYGAYFSHESETAGLGALIADEPFQKLFNGKHIFADTDTVRQEPLLTVVKNGKVEPQNQQYQVDGITGATLTSNGVADMVKSGLKQYTGYFKSLHTIK